MARRAIYLMEEVYFHPMNSRRPLEYLTWLTGDKREDEQRKAGEAELTSGCPSAQVTSTWCRCVLCGRHHGAR